MKLSIPSSRIISYLSIVISLCLLCQLLLTYKLWTSQSRTFPLIPVFENWSFDFLEKIDILTYGLLIAFLIGILFFAKKALAKVLFLGLAFVLVLQDINRLQVWFYQLSLMLLVLTFINNKNEKAILNTLQFMMIAVYFWSGIHKFNIYFTEHTLPWLFEKPAFLQSLIDYKFLSPLTAAFETGLGLGLLFPITRKVSLILAIIFHSLILFLLGPFGHNWNEVVWPWNVAMILLLYLLFYQKTESIWEEGIAKIKIFPLSLVIVLLFGLLPGLNFYHAWDEQLSFKMYSGANPEGVFFFHPEDQQCLPKKVAGSIYGTETKRLTLDDWAFEDLKVPPYVSQRTLKRIGYQLCTCVQNPDRAGIDIIYFSRRNQEEDLMIPFACKRLLRE